jgi:tRNA G37 N-methylase Trm5
MSEEIINIIVLQEKGNIIEEKIDMNKDKDELGIYLQDKISFIGQIIREEDNNKNKSNIILIKGLNAKNKGKRINKCKLPIPFDKEEIYGDIILLPMNSDIKPENIFINEYYDLFE